MSAGRLHYSAAQLAALAPRQPSWPVVSIALLCVFGVIAAPGFITVMNLYLLALALIVWLVTRAPVERPLMVTVAPFGALLAIGVLGSAGADRYLVLKDAWYGSNPAVLMAVGYVLSHVANDTRRGLRAFVIGGALVATLHLLRFALNPQLLSLQATQIRDFAGTGYNAAALGSILLLGAWGRWRERLGLPPLVAAALLLLCGTSVVLSFSRTMLLVMLIGGLATAGVFARREGLRIGGLLLAAGIAIGVLSVSVDTESNQARRSFVGKLARSFDELQSRERMSLREISENWRGFETQRAVDTWGEGNAAQLLFGRGFGFQVDLQMFQNLSRERGAAVRFIPIFHNGYVYLLVKTGIVGVLLYLGVLARLYLIGRRRAGDLGGGHARFEGRLMQACALILFVTTWVVSGAFNKFDMLPFLLLTGFALRALTRNGD